MTFDAKSLKLEVDAENAKVVSTKINTDTSPLGKNYRGSFTDTFDLTSNEELVELDLIRNTREVISEIPINIPHLVVTYKRT